MFLALGCVFGFVGVGLGAFGAHALRTRLAPERVAQFEIGVRYQLWHALALFAVVFVGSLRLVDPGAASPLVAFEGGMSGPAALAAGWLFVAGIMLFSGSLYALALSGHRRWGAVAPFGGACFLLGWLALGFAALTT